MALTLETTRLALRPFASGDWTAIDALLSDAEVTRCMHFAAWTEDRRREWFAWCLENDVRAEADAINWAITRKHMKDTEGVIGWFGIGAASDATVAGERSFGFLLGRAHWNRGCMTEALRAVLDYEFRVRATPRVHATCEVANVASARVMEKAGMRREKTIRDADFEGNWAVRHHCVLTSAEYEALRISQ